MAKDKLRPKARTLHEKGHSYAEIVAKLNVSKPTLMKWAHEDGWEKGKDLPKLVQIEKEKMETEAERLGITKGRYLAELALIGFSDMADFVNVNEGGGIEAIPFNRIEGGKTRILKKVREKRTIRQTSDKSGDILVDQSYEFELHDKLGALGEIGNAMGWKKVTIDPSDDFRDFYSKLRGEK